jgi:ABC-type uncharacterized transport system ATPase subunit
MAALQQALQAMPGIKKMALNDGTLQIACNENTDAVLLNQYCISKGIVLSHLLLRKKSLESKFMEITN